MTDAALPAPVKAKHGTLQDGKTVHFYFNFSAKPREFAYVYSDGMEMLSRKPTVKSQKLTLPAWELAIIKER